jgi:hypothetical protein
MIINQQQNWTLMKKKFKTALEEAESLIPEFICIIDKLGLIELNENFTIIKTVHEIRL